MINPEILFPYSFFETPWLAPCALLLDLRFGDPLLPWPHPVCLLGKLLNRLENPARLFMNRKQPDKARRGKAAGAVALLLAGCCAWLCALAFCNCPLIGPFLALYLAWAGLAGACLLSTGQLVLSRIERGNLAEAREACSWLVSRDTSKMDKTLLRKTLADTLAENYTDAFVAPFFWLLLAGPAGLWIYKAVSTADSQWGYKTEAWIHLGWAAARSDDFLAWLPARIAPALLRLAHVFARFFHKACWTGIWPGYPVIARQSKAMTSPNSGWSMAACAWLCNGRMGGPATYFGVLVRKGWIGPETGEPWDKKRLSSLLKLLRFALASGGIALLAVFLLLKLLLGLF